MIRRWLHLKVAELARKKAIEDLTMQTKAEIVKKMEAIHTEALSQMGKGKVKEAETLQAQEAVLKWVLNVPQ